MIKSSASTDRLIEELRKLPGIGRKTAQRLAFYLLKVSNEEALGLSHAIEEAKKKVRLCSVCFGITEKDPCDICSNKTRDSATLCVVEEATDVFAFERTAEFRGRYHVLGGSLSPLDGIGPEDIRVKELIQRVSGESIQEVIIATNTNAEGEATALYMARLLKPLGVKVTRIARGLPVGSDIDLADEVTLSRALHGRTEY
ncbi:MAG: recombination mediator RecR [bacterium]